MSEREENIKARQVRIQKRKSDELADELVKSAERKVEDAEKEEKWKKWREEISKQMELERTIEAASDTNLWTSALFQNGDVVEFRCIAKPGGVIENKWAVYGADFENVLQGIRERQGSPAKYTIFMGTNPRKAKGLAGDKNITLARSLYVDFDTDLQGNDGCSFDQAILRIRDVNLPPASMVVATPRGVHAYWLLDEPLTNMQQFTAYQLWLISKLGTDKTIHNPERIMRVPGFECQKRPGKNAHLIDCEVDMRYSLDEFEALKKGAELDNALGLQIKTPWVWAPGIGD